MCGLELQEWIGRTSLQSFAKGLFLEEVKKIEGMRENNETCVFGLFPVEEIFEVGDKVWRIEVLVLCQNCV